MRSDINIFWNTVIILFIICCFLSLFAGLKRELYELQNPTDISRQDQTR